MKVVSNILRAIFNSSTLFNKEIFLHDRKQNIWNKYFPLAIVIIFLKK